MYTYLQSIFVKGQMALYIRQIVKGGHRIFTLPNQEESEGYSVVSDTDITIRDTSENFPWSNNGEG